MTRQEIISELEVARVRLEFELQECVVLHRVAGDFAAAALVTTARLNRALAQQAKLLAAVKALPEAGPDDGDWWKNGGREEPH